MAIILEEAVALPTATKYNRTWRTTIDTPFGGVENWTITFHRDVVYTDANGNLIKKETDKTIVVKFTDIAGKQVSLQSDPSKSATGQEIAEFIEVMLDTIVTEKQAEAQA